MCGRARALAGEGVALGESLRALAEGPGWLGLDPTGERLRARRAEVSPPGDGGGWHPRHAVAGSMFLRWRHVSAPAGTP